MPTLTAPFSALLLAAADGGHTFWSVALAILGIGFLIFIHELGHFLACRVTKTRVETFSIGFGRRLFGWETTNGARRFTVGLRRSLPGDGLDVRIAMIPLGGYVKMAGEIGGDGSATSGLSDEPRKPLSDEFPAKPFGSRALIISAGVIMNALVALVFFGIAYAAGLKETPPEVGEVIPGGAAWKAGLAAGDRIERFDGRTVRTFLDVQQGVALVSKGEPASVEVIRDGVRRTVLLSPEYNDAIGLQQAQLTPVASLELDDGVAQKLVIGPRERVVVSGRAVRGGAEVATVILDALTLGRESVDLLLPERPGPTSQKLSLARMRKAPAKPGPWKLGVDFVDRRRVAAVRGDGPASRSGLRAGDVIVAVDGQAVTQGAELAFRSTLAGLEVLRDGKRVAIEPRADGFAAVSAFLADVAFASRAEGGRPTVYPRGGDFPDRRSPAADAGVLPGDALLAIDGTPVSTVDDVMQRGASFDGSPVRLTVKTGDAPPRDVAFAPRTVADAKEREAFVGLAFPKEEVDVGGFGGAVAAAWDRTTQEIGNIFRLIGRFFGGGVSFQKNISGPVTIVNLSSQSASGGLSTFLAFLAFISVNLCVLNFLPIPVLDGGQMVFLLIEKVRGGRPLKEATIAKFQLVGFLLLLLLMGFALKNDFKIPFGK